MDGCFIKPPTSIRYPFLLPLPLPLRILFDTNIDDNVTVVRTQSITLAVRCLIIVVPAIVIVAYKRARIFAPQISITPGTTKISNKP